MELKMNEGLVRVVILVVNGIYTQIYDEVYCSKKRYNEILMEFGKSNKYKVVTI